MKRLINRTKNLVFRYKVDFEHGELIKEPLTLDYEDGLYRQKELARIIKDALIHFALTRQEIAKYKVTDDYGEMDRLVWSRISKARKNAKGDYGEALLFLILSVFYPTQKFVTKVRLRSSIKDQIKGYDCAHFTIEEDEVVLWLGEAKLHKNFSGALSDAIRSIKEHTDYEYLNDEIAILRSSIEYNDDFYGLELVDEVLNSGITIDKINIRIPILITYDCETIKNHNCIDSDEFIEDMKVEFKNKFKLIEKRNGIISNKFELLFIILPLSQVSLIKDEFERMEEILR